ncbi:MAG: glycosyltransferase [Bacteroidales bacterium]|nr:glycosyltransferase [Bacteroidales bacterium]
MRNPLVSVCVVTYNSSTTVLHTLESVKKQSYKNIELIISDDCSTDDTVSICRDWLVANGKSFIRSKLVTSDTNTGIAPNLNRCISNAHGDWIKSIAGDDVLIEECIESNVNYINNNNNCDIIVSKVCTFGDENILRQYAKVFKYGLFDLRHKEVKFLMLVSNYILAPTVFMKKSVFIDLGGYDENMPFLEDWPFWLKAIFSDKCFAFNNSVTVLYRMSSNSVSLTSPSIKYKESIDYFYSNYLPSYQRKVSYLLWLYFKTYRIISRKEIKFKLRYKILILINPVYYYLQYLRHRLNKFSQKYNNE